MAFPCEPPSSSPRQPWLWLYMCPCLGFPIRTTPMLPVPGVSWEGDAHTCACVAMRTGVMGRFSAAGHNQDLEIAANCQDRLSARP